MELFTFLGKDKEGVGQISALINNFKCEKIFIVKDKETENPFSSAKCKMINIAAQKDILSLRDEINEKIKKENISDFEVAVSLASGSGKENMALVSALLSVPLGIKLVVYTKKGIEFLS